MDTQQDGRRAASPQQATDEASMEPAEKVRENRLRRMAERQGLRLEKSRRRDPRAIDYGTYQLVDVVTNARRAVGWQSGYGLTLDGIEEELTK